jgi:hypothetical protein
MFSTFVLSALALSGQALAVNFTSTSPADVAAARDSALTLSPTSKVHGRAFDRFVTIWLENTDFDKAASDPNLAWLATKGITLSNYNGVTHPSEPNYVASIGGVSIIPSNTHIEANCKTKGQFWYAERQL